MAISAVTQYEQQNDQTTGAVMADCLFGGLGALSSTFDVAAQAWDVADPASEIYKDRSLAHQNRTNGLDGCVMSASTDPSEPKALSAGNNNLPYWKRADMEFNRKHAPRLGR